MENLVHTFFRRAYFCSPVYILGKNGSFLFVAKREPTDENEEYDGHNEPPDMYARIGKYTPRKRRESLNNIIGDERKHNMDKQSHLDKAQEKRLPPWTAQGKRMPAPCAEE